MTTKTLQDQIEIVEIIELFQSINGLGTNIDDLREKFPEFAEAVPSWISEQGYTLETGEDFVSVLDGTGEGIFKINFGEGEYEESVIYAGVQVLRML